MLGNVSRRLTVRDDGTGKKGHEDVFFAQFGEEQAIVILGDPGIGKTTLLKEVAGDGYFTVRRFLANPQAALGKTVFLDALDEYRNVVDGQDAVADVARALCAIGKPPFRLSCRAADWLGSIDHDVLEVASGSGRIVVLELRELSPPEIIEAVRSLLPDPTAFLAEANEAGLTALLGNPQTLDLIVRAWKTEKKPRNKFEAYQLGVQELLREPNPGHIHRMQAAQPSLERLTRAAGTVAATLLLSNASGISRAEATSIDGSALLSDLANDDPHAIEAALKRRVFSSTRSDYFEFIHRTVEEFLAATELQRRIVNGLSVSRVLALVCAVDGRPVSSLRGLFAWLMCALGDVAETYVSLDPYAVANYGDASALPPNVQRALWAGLRQLQDPWFLANEDDRGSFKSLANRHTSNDLLRILGDTNASPHLKVAALEAISTSKEELGATAIVRRVALQPSDNTWLRVSAISAFLHLVRSDGKAISRLDMDLAKQMEGSAVEVRVELLRKTLCLPGLAARAISVLKHLTSASGSRRSFGRLFRLGDELPHAEIEAVLDSAGQLLRPNTRNDSEIESLFETLLARRIRDGAAIDARLLAKWLRSILIHRDPRRDVFNDLRERLHRDPELLPALFDALTKLDTKSNSFWVFAAHHLWQVLPPSIWPVLPARFFLQRARQTRSTARAADLFRLYLAWFPSQPEATVQLAEDSFDFLEARPAVRQALGEWNVCKIEGWREDDRQRRQRDREQLETSKRDNIAALKPQLVEIASGANEAALVWATQIYMGYMGVQGTTPSERFNVVANREIEEACIQGLIAYVDRQDIATTDEIVAAWKTNRIPVRHALLTLSVYLRATTGGSVPSHAVGSCVAAVVTGVSSDKVPDFEKTTRAWYIQQSINHPDILRSLLPPLWLSKRDLLAGFYELRDDASARGLLVELCAETLRSPLCNDRVVQTLVPILVDDAQRIALSIGLKHLADPCLTNTARGVWIAASYLIDPTGSVALWKDMVADSSEMIWEAIELIGGGRRGEGRGRALTNQQRCELIASVGRRFPPAEHPSERWGGQRNPWDASDFISRQIQNLASDISRDASICLETLARDSRLTTYRDLIRHARAQQERLRRELDFTIASPKQVSEAILNLAPATPSDLLACVADHIDALSRELARTQRERYRAYWNEDGRKLVAPKREEACSALLADDLLNRVRALGLVLTVEHHMVDDKECDIVVLQAERLLPIEAKHHYHSELWTAWRTQLDKLYTRDAGAGGLGIYLVFWSGEAPGRKIPKLPKEVVRRPKTAEELRVALESQIPPNDGRRLFVRVVDIAPPAA